jgi:hypothetical protein
MHGRICRGITATNLIPREVAGHHAVHGIQDLTRRTGLV